MLAAALELYEFSSLMIDGEDTLQAHLRGKEEKGMWGKGWVKKTSSVPYNKEGKIPVIRASICTGEKVAGFKDAVTGKFEDLMLIKTDADLQQFLQKYQVEEKEIKKEW